ncbi:MAG TPA: endonuclease/exonuclease/phosphatase family protein [Rhodothermales bacterium]
MLRLALASLALLGTAIPLVRHDRWWIRVFDFPRMHIGAAAMAALVATVGRRRRAFSWPDALLSTALGVAAVYQATRILPYTPLYPRQVKDADPVRTRATLRLLVANVLMSNRQTEALLDLIRANDPDLVLTVETDSYWADALSALGADYPHVVSRPLDNTYGMILYSRRPLENPEVRFLIESDIPSIHTHVTLDDGTRVRLYFLHPKPPYPKEDDATTDRDAELLLVGKDVAESGEIAVVAGDLNDVAWSYTTHLFQRISRMLDPRIGRGMYNTFHAGLPLMRWPLDHVFHTEHFKLVRLERLPSFGSDHFPIFIEIAVDDDAPAEQEEPRADAEDRELANEKIDKARQSD